MKEEIGQQLQDVILDQIQSIIQDFGPLMSQDLAERYLAAALITPAIFNAIRQEIEDALENERAAEKAFNPIALSGCLIDCEITSIKEKIRKMLDR